MPIPDWLERPAGAPGRASGRWPRDRLLERVRNSPIPANLRRLEEYVRRNPNDREAFRLLVQQAIDAGEVRLLQRVRSLARRSERESPLQTGLRVGKWLVGLGVLGLAIWQAWLLIRDWQSP